MIKLKSLINEMPSVPQSTAPVVGDRAVKEREAIAHYVNTNSVFDQATEEDIAAAIDELHQVYDMHRNDYTSVEHYLDDIDKTGGLSAFLNKH